VLWFVAVSVSVTQSRVAWFKLMDVGVNHRFAIFNWWDANPKRALIIFATYSFEVVAIVAVRLS
jgi:hypothetical protein